MAKAECPPHYCLEFSTLWSEHTCITFIFLGVTESPGSRSTTLVAVHEAVDGVLKTRDIEKLNKSQVCHPRFGCSKALILLKHRWQAPILQSSQAPNKATSSMLYQDAKTFRQLFFKGWYYAITIVLSEC